MNKESMITKLFVAVLHRQSFYCPNKARHAKLLENNSATRSGLQINKYRDNSRIFMT